MINASNEAKQLLLDQVATGRLARRRFLSMVGAATAVGAFGPLLEQAFAAGANQEERRTSLQGHYDFIVVGAGAAGSVLGAELSASGAQVLIIESGGPDDAPTIANPSVWFYNVGGPLDYNLPLTPSPRLNNRKFNMALGHVLGVAAASTPWCGTAACNGTTTAGRKTEPRAGPLPTCFRFSRLRKIGRVAPIPGVVSAAPRMSAAPGTRIPPRRFSSTLPDRWA